LPFPLTRILRVVVAVGLTAFVVYQYNPSKILHATAGADLRWIGLAIALVLVDRTLMALRWIDLLSALTPGSRPRFGVILRIFFVSSFVSNFVPSVAADMYRAYALARHDVHLAESTASVLMDRVLGVLSMVIVGAGALIVAPHMLVERSVVVGLALAFAGCAVAALVVFNEWAAAGILAAIDILPSRAVHRASASLMDAVRRYARHHGELARVLTMSIVVQGLRILQAWALGMALGLTLPLAAYFVFMPIILVIMQIPITVNGFGTTQVAFERLFVPAGAPAPEVIAMSLLFLILGLVGTLPGALLYASTPAERRQA
jgi:uncharacterized protein (TIRG00374 family)